jgi:hypothetical protein
VTATGGGRTATAAVTVVSSLLAPWSGRNLGGALPAGSAIADNGLFSITGAGIDIWATSDTGYLVQQPLSGDVTVIARIASQQNTNAWAKAGVMIRETLEANSKHVFMCVTPLNGTAFQWRPTIRGTSLHTAGREQPPRG